MNRQKGQTLIFLLIGILVIALAGGAYYFGRQTAPESSPNPVVTSQTPKLTPPGSAETANSDSVVANWKTYTNSAYKFSLKYPSNYLLKGQSNINSRLFLVTISNPTPRSGGGYNQPHIEIVVFKNDAEDLNSWLNKHTTTLPFDDPSVSKPGSQFFYRGIKNKKEILLDRKKAITFESTAFESSPTPILTANDNYIVGFIFDNENESKDPSLKEIYPEILSTFKFTQ